MLPSTLKERLREHLASARGLHERDLRWRQGRTQPVGCAIGGARFEERLQRRKGLPPFADCALGWARTSTPPSTLAETASREIPAGAPCRSPLLDNAAHPPIP